MSSSLQRRNCVESYKPSGPGYREGVLAILHSVLRSLKVLEELVLRTLLQIEVG
jgi:hypothetical protein